MGFTEDDQLEEPCYEATGESFPGTTPQPLIRAQEFGKLFQRKMKVRERDCRKCRSLNAEV